MRKIWKKLIGFFKSGGRNFLYFFLIFTGLFLILTAIIIQTVSMGIFGSTDSRIKRYTENPTTLVTAGFHILTSDPHGSTNQPFFDPTAFVVLYDANGNVLNRDPSQIVEGIIETSVKFDKSKYLNTIRSVEVNNPFSGPDYIFRTTMIPIQFTNDLMNYPFKQVAYIQVFVDVSILPESMARATSIIIVIMIIFWFLSLFVAVILSQWSLKPLQLALDRQKAFVSNASHELRTPLAILQNRLELLFQKPDATILDEVENVTSSLNEVRNMRMLTSNLLDMAKSEGRLKVEPQSTSPDFFKEVFSNYQMLATKSGKAFKGTIQFDTSVNIDRELVKQVLTIFFDNAIKYTGKDGQVSIDISKTGQQLQVVVNDNGPGISDADKKKIFDRFFRVDEARTRGAGGLGLGLSLAQGIVSTMKGKITVEDNPPRGTRFIIRFKA